ncbi:murein hydrolase activator EnvC family protein [Fictibacillus phosphorivorans]|uniref:murein hydrolase activator EnvC family protein n=1 Tax=Fictibacillus phosphorivorans TaxID=1221500 RepID=UPI00203B92E9|nr:M23 family metallopeptidase [Fictibacillus phosphorivorans]MCM3718209.1 peptidoglycan DD-metalloendopeptidase family protein [Fictibacillus phosphorivorans]MCM3775924.1 peptidoglycan DD-metalloendopeptidase family protein [Fictibacillus phosphorivorans]
MKRKLVIATLSLSLAFSTYTVSAETLSSIKEKKEQNRSEQNQTKSELKANKNQQDHTVKQIEDLESSIDKTLSQIGAKKESIKETKASIEKLKKEISVLEKRIKERDELLKERVSSMYESGGAVNYLDVLLGAKDFGDFLDRVFALNVIAEQDKAILEEHKQDKADVEMKKGQVESELTSLNKDLKALEGLNQKLTAQKKQKSSLLAQLEKEEEHLHEHIMALDEKNDLLSAQEAAIKAEIARAKKEEEERKKREAAAKAAAEAAAAKAKAEEAARKRSSNSGSSSPAPTPAPTPAPAPTPVSRDFIFPTQGIITSTFGNRSAGMHYGMDIAQRGSAVPIVAAASGTVSRAYTSSSYGNCVFITHYINGQLYTTIYAHMRTFPAVRSGQTVSQGTFLGYQGNTGASRGQHLHFELHKGPWNASKSNAVDPRPYIQ